MPTELALEVAEHSNTRLKADALAMAIAVQANLVQLIVVDSHRRGISPKAHEISVVSPGTVKRFRETLIDRHLLKAYSEIELRLRLREIWGQFCLMCWVFHQNHEDNAAKFAMLSDEIEMRCDAHLAVKHDEIHAILWRLRFEHVIRHDRASADQNGFAELKSLADQIPAQAMGRPVTACTDDELLAAACEHAGMLAAIRWVMDRRRIWGGPGIMDVAERPF